MSEYVNIDRVLGSTFCIDAKTNCSLTELIQKRGSAFLIECNKMLGFYLEKFPEKIKSADVIKRLSSKKESDFEGKWSELIFGYYLNNLGYELNDISVKEKTNDGEKEICDLRTNLGDIEVACSLSKNGQFPEMDSESEDDPNNAFSIDMNITGELKKIILSKIHKKNDKNIIAIDCTYLDEMRHHFDQISDENFKMYSDISIFRKDEKNIFLFLRNPITEQVSERKIVL